MKYSQQWDCRKYAANIRHLCVTDIEDFHMWGRGGPKHTEMYLQLFTGNSVET